MADHCFWRCESLYCRIRVPFHHLSRLRMKCNSWICHLWFYDKEFLPINPQAEDRVRKLIEHSNLLLIMNGNTDKLMHLGLKHI
jgi:hypothetical protein